MHSKAILKPIGILLWLLLGSCEEGGDNPLTNSTDVLSKEDLLSLTDQINFEVKMPDGNMAIFNSSVQYTSSSEVNFTEMGSTDFVDQSSVLIELEDNFELSGYIEFKDVDQEIVEQTNFTNSYCTTYEALRLKYGHLNLSPSFDDYVLIMAFDFYQFEVLDVFEGNYINGNWLYFVLDPFGELIYAEYNTLDKKEYWLNDTSFSQVGSKFISKGVVEFFPFSYEFVVSCP